MATQEITISELELADEVLADMTLPVDTATETRAVTLKQLRAWLGSSLPTGFIIPAVGKISDERFTLLDGKTLSRAGTYEAFCNKVVSEVQAGNWFACSEDEYAQDMSDFGQCGKFVVSNDYIRIPTITRFIGATITLSEIGMTYKESLPQHTHTRGTMNIEGSWTGNSNTAVFKSGSGAGYVSNSGTAAGGGGAGFYKTLNFDASRNWTGSTSNASGETYQDGAKVQPDHTKYPYYMVISTEGQTAEVGIDINEVYEDMNLKANTNLSNLTAEGKSLASGLGMPSERYVDLTLGATGSSYTSPSNGWFAISKKSGAVDQYVNLAGTEVSIIAVAPSSGTTASCYLPVRKGDIVKCWWNASGTLNAFRFVYAEGEK